MILSGMKQNSSTLSKPRASGDDPVQGQVQALNER